MIAMKMMEQELELLEIIASKLDRISSQLDARKTGVELDRLYTVEEAASHLNVPRSWIYKATSSNKIAYSKVGKYVRFKLSDLEGLVVRDKPETE